MTNSEWQAVANDLAAYGGLFLVGYSLEGLFGAGAALFITAFVFAWGMNHD